MNPYLNFNGQCEEAFKFYEQILDGKITFMMKYGEAPEVEFVTPETHHLIMHATLSTSDGVLMGADVPPDRYEQPRGIQISLHFKDAAEAERVFEALAENGNVQMSFQKTFWAVGFGMCTDRFGIPWMVNCEQAT